MADDIVSAASDIFKRQLQHCERQLQKCPQDELLLKALASINKAILLLQSSSLEAATSQSQVKEALQSYTQSVLDSTYHEESQLVDQEFPPDCAQGKIKELIGSFCTPVTLCGSPEQALFLLDTQLVECLHWRVGALIYMYCHTLCSSEHRKRSIDPQHFLECCSVGVCHLKLMLTARTPLRRDEDFVAMDSSLPQLLQEGIFSDIHMLALMYAGELCYWSWETKASATADLSSRDTVASGNSKNESPKKPESCTSVASSQAGEVNETSLFSLIELFQGESFVDRWRSEFDASRLGQEFLSKYVDIARGPLKLQQWNYERAVQLLVKLKKGSPQK